MLQGLVFGALPLAEHAASLSPMGLKAVVRDGYLRLEEPTDLPEGTVLELVVDDEEDELTPEQLQALNRALERGVAQLESGQWVDGDELLARLTDPEK